MQPHLSVCVCAFNGAEVLARAIDSVLGQTYGDFELLIVDDASTDDTSQILHTYRDKRLRVVRNNWNLGNARNRSRAIQLSRSELIKFVDQDDWLEPSCLEEHMRCMDANPSVGLTFSRCAIALENPRSSEAESWSEWSRRARCLLAELDQVNKGGKLLERLIREAFRENWVGGPTSVMLRRRSLHKSRLFNRRLRQLIDLDLWIRLMAVSDVGYLDQELAVRWVGRINETNSIRAARRDWLDRLWLLEGLSELPMLWKRYPELAEMRRAELKSAAVATLTGNFRTTRLADALSDIGPYVTYRLGRSRSRGSILDRL